MDQVYAVHVYGRQGQQVAGIGRRRAAVPTAEAVELAGQRERQEGSADLGEETLESVFQPLTDEGGRIAGLLQVTRHSSAVQAYLDRARAIALLAIGLAGLLLTGVIVLGHHFGIGRHLIRLEGGMRRIREGDLEHRLAIAGAAEFRDLARGINRMLDGITASQREIERRRETEQLLRERLHRAEKMAAIGRLAGGIAHELGSPLSTLYGRTQQLLRRPAMDDTQRAALEDIGDNALRIEKTIRQLMDFGRSNPLNRVTLDLSDLLHRLAADARALSPEGVEIEVDCDPRIRIAADPLRIEQALRNLVDNAAQAARTRLRISADADAQHVRIHVADDGPGVPAESRDLVFDPFYTTKPVGQGTGLGLSVASAAAEDHDGHLGLDDDVLGGARFTLTLPRETADENA
nr:HAMP domain-containing sensor histidine kinase [Wenzhouxiangella sp. XN24]